MTNSTNEPLAFKVKTTAPKLYCVRPNASVVPPGETIRVSLILQGFTQHLPKDYKCKDKFLIVSLPCPDLEDSSKVGENWSQLEAKYKDQLLQKKLKVNFIIADDTQETPIDESFANVIHLVPLTTHSDFDLSKSQGTVDSEVDFSVRESSLDSSDLQRELLASTSKINALSEKLDSNEAAAPAATATAPAATATAPTEFFNGVSFPLAILLVVLALLLGYYLF